MGPAKGLVGGPGKAWAGPGRPDARYIAVILIHIHWYIHPKSLIGFKCHSQMQGI